MSLVSKLKEGLSKLFGGKAEKAAETPAAPAAEAPAAPAAEAPAAPAAVETKPAAPAAPAV